MTNQAFNCRHRVPLDQACEGCAEDRAELAAPASAQASEQSGEELFRSGYRLALASHAETVPQASDAAQGSEDLKAIYVKWRGNEKGWLGIEGSYFIAGYQAAALAQAAPQVPAGQLAEATQRLTDLMTEAFGARHPAIDDLAVLILNTRASMHPEAPQAAIFVPLDEQNGASVTGLTMASQAAQPSDAEDAARYRHVRAQFLSSADRYEGKDQTKWVMWTDGRVAYPSDGAASFDAAIDAARASKGEA